MWQNRWITDLQFGLKSHIFGRGQENPIYRTQLFSIERFNDANGFTTLRSTWNSIIRCWFQPVDDQLDWSNWVFLFLNNYHCVSWTILMRFTVLLRNILKNIWSWIEKVEEQLLFVGCFMLFIFSTMPMSSSANCAVQTILIGNTIHN